MEARSPNPGLVTAAVGAGILILSMLVLNWYEPDVPGGGGGEVPSLNAFEGLTRVDVALALAAVVALALAAGLLTRALPDPELPMVALVGAGLFAVAVALYRGPFNPPPYTLAGIEVDTTVKFGWAVGFVASVAIAVGGALALLASRPRGAAPPPERPAP